MTEDKAKHTDGSTPLKTAAGVAAGLLVAGSLLVLVWRTGWHIPFVTGWLSVKLGAKAGALTVGGLIAFAVWRTKRGGTS
ncbi:hypothetical protein ACFVGY_15865 [Streptomyces sp. NPDC127106]|uniref:hypothetical protein n=1 Tax=Streptomyces sp. NPDC127106 TaxID=3345360 RepID=UPI00363E9113